jgi:hypothetical protein
MLGKPADQPFPVRAKQGEDLGPPQAQFRRDGFVSVWVGNFASVEEAEKYFGTPDEIGIYLPPDAFAADFFLGEFPPDTLEVHFEQVESRPIEDLLRDATFSLSFEDQVVKSAREQGLREAQGIALLYDFDYLLNPSKREAAGPLRFIGSFPFLKKRFKTDLQPFHELARRLGLPTAAVLFVTLALQDFTKKLRPDTGKESVPFSARE